MNADGSGFVDTGIRGEQPTWSPDGSRIAYVASHRPGGLDGISVMDADGTHPADLVRAPYANSLSFFGVAWSPDGSQLAFSHLTGTTLSGNWDVEVMAADGRGAVRNLTAGSSADDHSPAWSPDGSRISFSRGSPFGNGGDGDLYVMNADGSGQTLLVDGSALQTVRTSAWSPDGSRILFGKEAVPGVTDLFTVDPDGSHLQRLTTNANVDLAAQVGWAAPTSYPLAVSRTVTGAGSVTSSPGGISCGGGCTAAFPDGTPVTLTAAPAPGSTFGGWSGACSGVGGCTVSMLAARAVTATFTAQASGGGGSGGGGGGGGGGGNAADLAVEGSVAPQTAKAGDTLTWTFRVVNANLGPAVDVVIDLTPSANLTYVSSTTTRGPGCVNGGGKVHCFLDWLSGDAPSATVTVTETATASGDYTVTATVGQLIAEANVANNTLAVKATQPSAPPSTPPPPAPVRPTIGSPVAAPHAPAAGKRFTVAFPVRRSTDGRPLAGGTAACTATVGGRTLKHTTSFANGSAKVVLTVPRHTRGQRLSVKVIVTAAGGTATRVAGYRIH